MWTPSALVGLTSGAATAAPVLVDAAVKGAVVLAAAWLATEVFMRQASAAARHALWLLALASLLVIPVLSAALPHWQVLPDWMALKVEPAKPPVSQEAESVPPKPVALPRRDVANPLTPRPENGVDAPAVPVTPSDSTVVPHDGGAVTVRDTSVAPAPAQGPGVGFWLVLTWMAGTLLALMPMLMAKFVLRRLERSARRLEGDSWPTHLKHAQADLGVRRHVVLLCGQERLMPMQWGIIRPTVLLPGESEAWDTHRRRVVLLHELAHVKRWDSLWQALVQVIGAAYWFNPLAWVAARRLAAERERACDDLVLEAGRTNAPDYAQELLQVATKLCPSRVMGAAAIAMARPNQLEGRLLAILDPKRNRCALTLAGALIGLSALIGLTVPLAMLRGQTASAPAASPATSPATSAGQLSTSHTATLPANAKYGDQKFAVWTFNKKSHALVGFAQASLVPGAALAPGNKVTLETVKGHALTFTLGQIENVEVHDTPGGPSHLEPMIDLTMAHGSGPSRRQPMPSTLPRSICA